MSAVKIKQQPVHKDIFGRVIQEGSTVAFPQSNTLMIGTVGKCTAKKVRVHPVGGTSGWYAREGHLKYAHELVNVEGKDVTMYILKNSK